MLQSRLEREMLPSIEIPPLPVARVRALSLVTDGNASLADLIRVISSDPALTAAVLRGANSALSSPVMPVRTAQIAVVRMGMTETRRIVLGVAMSSSFRDLRLARIDEDEMWRHLIATAILADATAWGEVKQTEAFTAGLLHDLGRLAMAAGDPGRYARVVELVGQGCSASKAERVVFGVDHSGWGEEIARSWGFPLDIVQAIGEHHASTQHGISWVVARAREMAAGLGIGDGIVEAGPLDPASEAAMLPVISDLGGSDSVLRRVGWYQGAIAAAA